MDIKEHRWSGWPGAFCLDCGCEDPREIALANGDYIEVQDDSEVGFHPEFPNIKPEQYECPLSDEREG
jgi:hypothetical protein